MLNRYMQYGTVHDATCSRLRDRKAQWYCHSIDSFQYILFQPQLRKVYGDAFTVRDADDVQRIAGLLRTWDTTLWAPVMDQHLRDLSALYERAPALQSPMTTYRGQQRAHLFGDLCGAQSNTERRVISSSLDASVAAFFAYDIKQVRGAPRPQGAPLWGARFTCFDCFACFACFACFDCFACFACFDCFHCSECIEYFAAPCRASSGKTGRVRSTPSLGRSG